MAWLWIEKNHLSRKYNIICQFKYLIDSNYTKFIICAPIFCSKRLFSSECWANYSNLFSRIILLTLHNDDAVGAVWAQPVAGHALVLAAVAGLAVDDLDGDHAVRVGYRVHARVQRLAGLKLPELDRETLGHGWKWAFSKKYPACLKAFYSIIILIGLQNIHLSPLDGRVRVAG